MVRRILVADDDPLIRALISVSLGASCKLEMVEATDGTETLRRLRTAEFDAVILDWQMPGKSGLEIVRTIRSRGSRMPILMITAEARKNHVIEALKAGVSDYLIKPFDAHVLREKLERLLPGGVFPRASKSVPRQPAI
jgi:two-component system chemotaxis response regulator CheY